MNSRLLYYSSIIIRILFFGFLYLFFLFGINPAISYFIQQPVFLINKEFLYEHLSYPGGLIEYISQFLAQFYYYPWLGALVLTLVTWCISYITLKILRSLKFDKHLLILQLIPAIGLLFIHCRHDYMLTTTMMLLSSVVFYYLYLKLNNQRLIFRLSGIIISSFILYYISGGGVLLHYLSMCLVSELFNPKKYDFKVISLIIILGLFIPYLSVRLIFYITLKQAYFYLLYSEPYYHPPFILYVLFIYLLIIIVYVRKVTGLKYFKGISMFIRKKVPDEKHISGLSFLIQLILIIILTGLTVRFAVEPEQALVNEVKYLAYNEEWDELLGLVKENPSNDRFVNFHTNRALYHTGKLADEMFDYPQTWGKHALFMGEIVVRTVLMDNSDIYFDLAHVRAAQHWAYEAQTIYENSPRVLKRLAMTNIILGNYKPAGSILGILRKSLINKDWADYYQNYIDDPLKIEKDSLIQNKRNLLPRTVFFMDRINVNYDLLNLLDENEKNKMAFEYLMAYYLLSNEIGNVIINLRYIEKLGYKQIPRIYEEALMVYISKTGIKSINLGGYNISETTIERYRDYARIVHKYDNDIYSARDELFNNYGNTYWYYLHFTSPVTTKRDLQFKVIE